MERKESLSLLRPLILKLLVSYRISKFIKRSGAMQILGYLIYVVSRLTRFYYDQIVNLA